MRKSAGLKWAALSVAVALGITGLAACGDGETSEKGKIFTVTYYDGSAVLKTEKVAKDGKAIEWTPEKQNQEFVDWFATPSKSIRYDFDTLIKEDTSIFAGFSVYEEDVRDWAILGSGKSDLLSASDWGKVILDEHKLTKTTGKNEYSITLDLYSGDEFQFALNTSWHNKRGYGYLETATNAAGEESFGGSGGIGETAAKGQNIKVVKDGNYTLTLHTYPGDDYYDTENAHYSEANKEVYNISPYDTITWVRNGDAATIDNVVTEYYIKGAGITQWADMYNEATKMAKLLDKYTLTIYLKANEEFMFTSRFIEDGKATTGSEYIRYGNLDAAGKALFEGSNNLKAKAAGEYTFTYNAATSVLSATLKTAALPELDYYLDGNFGGLKWNESYFDADYKFTAIGDDVYKLADVELDEGKEFIIQSFTKGATATSGTKNNAYNFKYYRGGADTYFVPADANKSNYNFKISQAGTYDIEFDAYAKIITITPSGAEDTVHIKGSFVANWNIIDAATGRPSDTYKLTKNAAGKYEITMTITAAMVAEGASWQAGLMINTTRGSDGEFVGASALGADAADNVNNLFRPEKGNNLTCTRAGTYKIVLDIETKTIHIYSVPAA